MAIYPAWNKSRISDGGIDCLVADAVQLSVSNLHDHEDFVHTFDSAGTLGENGGRAENRAFVTDGINSPVKNPAAPAYRGALRFAR